MCGWVDHRDRGCIGQRNSVRDRIGHIVRYQTVFGKPAPTQLGGYPVANLEPAAGSCLFYNAGDFAPRCKGKGWFDLILALDHQIVEKI